MLKPTGPRGAIDMILRLFEQEEITRSKARELIEDCVIDYQAINDPPGRAPWDKLNWCSQPSEGCGEWVGDKTYWEKPKKEGGE